MFTRKFVTVGMACASLLAARAQFNPLLLTPESYNHDIVVESAAPAPPAPATTATLDAGTNNTAFTFYEMGFNQNAGEETTGLPAPGTTITSETFTDHTFALPASYAANNAMLVNAQVTNATYTLTTPAALSGISFLAASGGGAPTLTYIVTHADNTTETGTLVVPDWFNAENRALTLNGRVNAVTRAFGNVNSDNPRLYSVDIALSNATSPVTKIELQRNSGNGNAAIFAVSGSTGAEFTPLAGAGFNYDVIIEANAEPQRNLQDFVTATIDAGSGETGATWYEVGYNTNAPATGLPAVGTKLTNAAAADHIYQLPADYTVNNAILIDALHNAVTITPTTPTTASGLSFLGSSGNGAVTVGFTLTHADASTQTGSFVVPDWFNATPVAYTVNGRVNVQDASFSSVNGNNPRVYGVDVAVNNTGSPITQIDLTWNEGNGHAGILAISSSGGAIKPLIDLQPVSINIAEGGTGQLDSLVSGTGPITVRWQVGTNGVFVNLSDVNGVSGSGTTNLVLANVTPAANADYVLVATNTAGATLSRVVRVNVVSTKTDVTSPFDTITAIGGISPDAEPVANAINDDSTKFLNFGTDGNTDAPFAGPVGFTVTLSSGSAIVTGMRVYTANDAEERDPADYLIEGSNDDGATYRTVASGTLKLPAIRNASGLAIDPLALANQEVRFANAGGYTTYRVTFTNVKNNTTANSMQLGEIELLGEFGAGAPELSITRAADGKITITSTQAGTLQSTPTLNPGFTWTDEGPISGSVEVTATGSMRFFRVIQPQP